LTIKDFEQIKVLMTQFAESVNDKIEGLKELLLEKLNGHGSTVERLQKEVDHLYQLDRDRVTEIGDLRAEQERIKGIVERNAAVSTAEENGRDKREQAVETVKSGITTAKLVWVSALVGLGGAFGAVMLTWALGGFKG
jgi:hypothetical protein